MHTGTADEIRDSIDLHATRRNVQHFHARRVLGVARRIGINRFRYLLRAECGAEREECGGDHGERTNAYRHEREPDWCRELRSAQSVARTLRSRKAVAGLPVQPVRGYRAGLTYHDDGPEQRRASFDTFF